MGHIKLSGVKKSYGAVDVIHGIDLDIRDGELVVFVGPSGCGKSTLLRMIAGLEKVTGGELSIDGKTVNDISAADRGLAMVFQSYALYPHMSVRQNLAFGLENSRLPKDQITARIAEAARMLEIEPYLERRPGQLSGGQRQRVAIGRAIVRSPVAFLLDEPLSNLDAELRGTTRTELAALHARLKATMVYVTHDQVEAMTLADRIVVLRAGRIEQVGTPLDLYNQPANRFVAGFIGSPAMNFLPVTVETVSADTVSLRLGKDMTVDIAAKQSGLTEGDSITLGVRPQHIILGGDGTYHATVRHIEALGAETVIHAEFANEKILIVAPGQHNLRPGETISLSLKMAPLIAFNRDGLRCL